MRGSGRRIQRVPAGLAGGRTPRSPTVREPGSPGLRVRCAARPPSGRQATGRRTAAVLCVRLVEVDYGGLGRLPRPGTTTAVQDDHRGGPGLRQTAGGRRQARTTTAAVPRRPGRRARSPTDLEAREPGSLQSRRDAGFLILVASVVRQTQSGALKQADHAPTAARSAWAAVVARRQESQSAGSGPATTSPGLRLSLVHTTRQ